MDMNVASLFFPLKILQKEKRKKFHFGPRKSPDDACNKLEYERETLNLKLKNKVIHIKIDTRM